MKRAIEAREVITVTADLLTLRGTYHKPQGEQFDSLPDGRIGILFLNPGVLPRAASGDSAVYWADSLAKGGYTAFRFDLPGLGDSDGDLPAEMIEFQSDVEAGAYGPVLSGIVDHLVDRFKLSGVVVAGHCAGAVTALYAAAANERIKGLILLNPHFDAQRTSEIQSVLVRGHLRIIRALAWDRPAQSVLRDAGVKLLACFRSIYRRLNHNPLLVRRKRLPRTANLPLIRCWNHVASAGLRMLILRSPSATPTLGAFDYIGHLQPESDRDCRITVKQIEGATHAFAEHHSKETVRTNTEQWLSAHFPLTKYAENRDIGSRSPELTDGTWGIVTNVH